MGKRLGKDGFSPSELSQISASEKRIKAQADRLKKEPREGEASPERGENDAAPVEGPVIAPPAGVPPPPPMPGNGPGKAIKIPGFTPEMIEAYKALKPDNYKGGFGKDGAFPPGLWPSIEMMTLSEGNKNLQAFGTKALSGKSKAQRDKLLEAAQHNFQASQDLIQKYRAFIAQGANAYNDRKNHVILRFMVDLLNAYKVKKKDIRAIEWPQEALTQKSFKKLLPKIQVAFSRLKTALESEQDTPDKLKEIKEQEEKAKAKALLETKLLDNWKDASASQMNNNDIKIFKSQTVRDAILSLYDKDLKTKKKSLSGEKPEKIMGALANLYVKPFIASQYENDFAAIKSHLSKQFMVELTAIEGLKTKKTFNGCEYRRLS